MTGECTASVYIEAEARGPTIPRPSDDDIKDAEVFAGFQQRINQHAYLSVYLRVLGYYKYSD